VIAFGGGSNFAATIEKIAGPVTNAYAARLRAADLEMTLAIDPDQGGRLPSGLFSPLSVHLAPARRSP
jgi:hypothetical protein